MYSVVRRSICRVSICDFSVRFLWFESARYGNA